MGGEPGKYLGDQWFCQWMCLIVDAVNVRILDLGGSLCADEMIVADVNLFKLPCFSSVIGDKNSAVVVDQHVGDFQSAFRINIVLKTFYTERLFKSLTGGDIIRFTLTESHIYLFIGRTWDGRGVKIVDVKRCRLSVW